MPKIKPNHAEFSDPRLTSVYNSVNTHYDEEKDFYLNLAKTVSASKIVDIGSGTGLLTLELARLGYQMTGVEPAKAMLDIARQSPEANKVKWIEGDILKLSELNFDLAMMTAHVAQFLLDEQYWLNNLESIHNALRTGGYLVFDSKNPTTRPWINSWPTKDSPRIVVDPTLGKTQWSATLIEINKNRVIYEIVCLIAQTGEELVSVNELIFRSKEEIIQSLIKSGFEIENIYGDWDSSSVTKESAEFIFVAKKI